MAKLNHKENICFIKGKQIHPMHIAIRPIARAFEKLQKCFNNSEKSLENFKVARIGSAMKFATEENCPYLYKKGGSCEILAYDLTK
jgi:hypothetical protein